MDNEQSLAWMPVLFQSDNIITLLLGKREGRSVLEVCGCVGEVE